MSTTTITPPVRDRAPVRAGAWAGLAWFVAAFGATTPESPGVEDATAAGIRSYAEQNQTTLAVNALSAVVGAVALLVLTAALARIIGQRRPDSVVPGFVLATGAVAAVQMLLFASIYSVWLVADPGELADGPVESLHAAGLVADLFGSLSIVVSLAMVVAVSWAALSERFLSRPVAVLGLVVAAAEAVSLVRLAISGSVFEVAMYVAIFGWFLWPAIVGADLAISLRRGRAHHRPRALSAR